jgi:hypothetical protein
VPHLPRSQSASASGFLPSYFKLGNSQRGGMPIMVNVNIWFLCNDFFFFFFT